MSYVVEGVLILSQTLMGSVHFVSGWFVVLACVVCWVMVMRECEW
jgi:hypothetical protein